MKKTLLVVSVLVIIFGAAGLWYVASELQEDHTTASIPDGKITVAATIAPLADIVSQVAGDTADVVQILPSGASPHLFSFSPKQIRELQDVRTIFAIGHGIDHWVLSVQENIPGINVIVVDDGVTLREFAEEDEHGHDEADEDDDGHGHEGIDPHYWLAFDNASKMAQTAANTLAGLDPAHAAQYQQRATTYRTTLDRTQEELTKVIAPYEDTHVITLHDAWGYFADSFDLEIVGVFEPAAGEEPTPQYLHELLEAIEHSDEPVQMIWSEAQLSDAAIASFSSDTGLPVVMLDPLGGVADRVSYIDMMRYNVNTVVEALE